MVCGVLAGCGAFLVGCGCDLQGCMTGVVITGQVEQSAPAEVDYELCRNGECVSGTVVEQTSPGSMQCTVSEAPFESTLCLWWPKNGIREVTGEVNLGRSHLAPTDGDRYTLRMSEQATARELAATDQRLSYESYNPNGSGCPGECKTASLGL